jgi:hypothetical protein
MVQTRRRSSVGPFVYGTKPSPEFRWALCIWYKAVAGVPLANVYMVQGATGILVEASLAVAA